MDWLTSINSYEYLENMPRSKSECPSHIGHGKLRAGINVSLTRRGKNTSLRAVPPTDMYSNILSDMYFGNLAGMCSNNLCNDFFDIQSRIHSDILSGIFSDIFSILFRHSVWLSLAQCSGPAGCKEPASLPFCSGLARPRELGTSR